jgi:hypothetical protein
VWREDGRPGARLQCRVLPAGEDPDPGRGEHRGTQHWKTCVNAGAARKCGSCPHRAHPGKVCKRLGKVECRTVETRDGVASIRGRWPCGCEAGDG